MNGLQLIATGGALPGRTVSNEELSRTVDTSDEWITTGIFFSRSSVLILRVRVNPSISGISRSVNTRAILSVTGTPSACACAAS